MSSQRGNTVKQRPQKHKNKHAFRNDMYDSSKKTKQLNELAVSNVCQRCKDCIEWKIKYKKYKPLTVPGKCKHCEQRKIQYAYHIICKTCALEREVCAKCNQKKDIVIAVDMDRTDEQREENYFNERLKHMRLREKKTLLRQVKRGNAVDGYIEKNDDSVDSDSDEEPCQDPSSPARNNVT